MRLEDLNLSVRCYNILRRAGVPDVEALLKLSREQIAALPRCTLADADTILEVLHSGQAGQADQQPGSESKPACQIGANDNLTHMLFGGTPLEDALYERNLQDSIDYTDVTAEYLAKIPGMTEADIQRLTDILAEEGLHLAVREPDQPDVADDDMAHTLFGDSQAAAQLVAVGLENAVDCIDVTENYLSHIFYLEQTDVETILATLKQWGIRLAQ